MRRKEDFSVQTTPTSNPVSISRNSTAGHKQVSGASPAQSKGMTKVFLVISPMEGLVLYISGSIQDFYLCSALFLLSGLSTPYIHIFPQDHHFSPKESELQHYPGFFPVSTSGLS